MEDGIKRTPPRPTLQYSTIHTLRQVCVQRNLQITVVLAVRLRVRIKISYDITQVSHSYTKQAARNKD